MAAKAPSRILLVAGIGFALACFVILNMVMQRLDPKYQEQMQQEAQRKAQEAQAAKGGATTGGDAAGKPEAVSASSSGAGNELAALGPDVVLGDKTSKREVTVGWKWTPEVQADPGKVYVAVQQMQQLSGLKIRLVNVDENPAVPPGISVAGASIAPLKEDGSIVLDTAVKQGMATAIGEQSRPK